MDHNQLIPAIAAGVQSRVPEGDIRAANRTIRFSWLLSYKSFLRSTILHHDGSLF